MVETATQLNASNGNNGSDSPEVIRAQIQQTRAHMSEIIDAIQVKLSPERLTQEAKDMVKDATIRKVEEMTHMATHKAETWRSQVVETVKQNPIPAALVGIGLGWLLMKSTRSPVTNDYAYPRRYYDTPGRAYGEQKSFLAKTQDTISENVSNIQNKASEMAQNLQGKIGEVTDTVQTRAGEITGDLQGKIGEVTDTVQTRAGEITSDLQSQMAEQTDYVTQQVNYQAQHAKRTVQETFEENPLVVGAMAVVAGAAVGLMLPITQQEDELMGPARDRFLQQAQDTAQETWKKVEHGAGEAYRAATEGLTTETESHKSPSPYFEPR